MTNKITKVYKNGVAYDIYASAGAAGTGDISGPDSSTDGHITVFDGTTGKVIRDSGVGVSDINTKTFYLSSTDDLTTAQAAYDWYKAGKNPIVVLDNKGYLVSGKSSTRLSLVSGYQASINQATVGGYNVSQIYDRLLGINLSGDTVTSVQSLAGNTRNFLRTDIDYSTPYTPTYNGSPATKKYVDDGLSTKADTSSLGTAAACNTGTSSGNVPVVGSNGELDSSIVPDVHTDAVSSVNGNTGAVTVEPGITKIFSLSGLTGSTNLTTATSAYTRYSNGGLPVINYSSKLYYLNRMQSTYLYFTCAYVYTDDQIYTYALKFNISSGSVTSINTYSKDISIVSSLPSSPTSTTIYLTTS